MVKLYWHKKSFISQVVEEKGIQFQAILDKLDFLDENYMALVKYVWVVDMLVEEKDIEK